MKTFVLILFGLFFSGILCFKNEQSDEELEDQGHDFGHIVVKRFVEGGNMRMSLLTKDVHEIYKRSAEERSNVKYK